MPQTRFVLRKALELSKKVGATGGAPTAVGWLSAACWKVLGQAWCLPASRAPPRAAPLPCARQVVVVVNKVDRPAARPAWVIDQTFELFLDLGASDEQCGECWCMALLM